MRKSWIATCIRNRPPLQRMQYFMCMASRFSANVGIRWRAFPGWIEETHHETIVLYGGPPKTSEIHRVHQRPVAPRWQRGALGQ